MSTRLSVICNSQTHKLTDRRYCVASDGSEVPIALEGAEHTDETGEDTHTDAESETSGENCHFHGTVE